MAGTIEFYAKPIPWAVEVKNIRAYTLLTTKFHAASPTTLQGTPERSFCCGHVVAKSLAIIFLFCSVCFSCRIVHRGFSCNNVEICGILFSYRPHPQPLPLKGGECLRSPRIFNRTVRIFLGYSLVLFKETSYLCSRIAYKQRELWKQGPSTFTSTYPVRTELTYWSANSRLTPSSSSHRQNPHGRASGNTAMRHSVASSARVHRRRNS